MEFPGTTKGHFRLSSSNASPAAKKETQGLVMAAASVVHMNNQHFHDIGILENLFKVNKPNYDRTIRILYWRGRQQLAIWDLFMNLVDGGFLSLDCLVQPMQFRERSMEVGEVVDMLYSFSYIDPPHRTDIFSEDSMWEGAVEWLAVTIVRSCGLSTKILDAIASTGILGSLDRADFESVCKKLSTFPHDPKTMEGIEDPYFGFWLPHGIGKDSTKWADAVQQGPKQFNRVEGTFKDYFQVTDDKVNTANMEKSFLGMDFPIVQDYKLSGQWMP